MDTRTRRQKEGIKKWLDNNGIGTLLFVTGFGKTWTATMAIKSLIKHNPNAKILISVPTDVLKKQWISSLVSNKVFENCEVQIINTIVKNVYNVDLLIVDKILSTLNLSNWRETP